MTVSFKAAEFPATTRDKAPNEYVPLVAEMVETGEARSAVVKYATEDDRKAVESMVQKVQAAGREVGVSVRKAIHEDGKGKATVYFRTVDAIKRPRKVESAETE